MANTALLLCPLHPQRPRLQRMLAAATEEIFPVNGTWREAGAWPQQVQASLVTVAL